MRSLPIPKIQLGRTFFVAAGILALGALAQIGAVCWKLAKGFPAQPATTAAPQAGATPAPAPPGLGAMPGFPGGLPGEGADLPPLAGEPEGAGALQQALPNPTPLAAVSKPVAGEAKPPADSPVPGLVAQARLMRGQGDTATALIRLKEALAIESLHYEALTELALTYEAMGLAEKAEEIWRQVYDSGEAAGVYFAAAEAKLQQAEKRDAPAQQPVQEGSSIGIGEVAHRDASVEGAGVKKVMEIPMRAKEGERIEVKDVVIQVYFYDQLEDGSILQTNANVSSKWTTAPIDWAASEPETLEVEYSDETAPAGSSRKYHGYVIRLYYRSELQDWRAEPESLRKQFPPPLNLLNDPNA